MYSKIPFDRTPKLEILSCDMISVAKPLGMKLTANVEKITA
jgi:hypothetical protein